MPKDTYKSIKLILPVLLIISALISCAHTPDITGKWREPGKASSIEFGKDGTFTATDDMGMTVNGNYTIQNKSKIRLEIKHPSSSTEIKTGSIVVQGDELKLIHDADNETLLYKKTN